MCCTNGRVWIVELKDFGIQGVFGSREKAHEYVGKYFSNCFVKITQQLVQ